MAIGNINLSSAWVKSQWLWLALLLFYLVSHLIGLTALPIFADESIYLRWSQLILDDPARYLFFALNDGKTPLFIWLQVPFLELFTNPLFAGRLLSVATGFFQVIIMGEIAWLVSKNQKAKYLAMLFTIILPFWFFHHRMALMDGMMTLFLSLAWWFLLKFFLNHSHKATKQSLVVLLPLLLSGLSFGLALWSKLPAILFTPIILVTPLFIKVKNSSQKLAAIFLQLGFASLVVFLGGLLFAVLKISPAFGQLFARGSDFLHPTSYIFSGGWQTTIGNFPSYFSYFWNYLSWPVIILAIIGLFISGIRRSSHLFFWSAVLFFLPIAIMGKVVYPRYFLPIAIPLTLSAAIVLGHLVTVWIQQTTSFKRKLLGAAIVVSMTGSIVNQSSLFMIPAWVQPNSIPFASADRTQYLTEWSSGHGITETVSLIHTLAENQTVAVATEGYFGTLPDAINVYLHGQDVNNLYVEGIGQPVRSIPESFKTRAKEFDQVLLVVNSHRLELKLDPNSRLASYCRPEGPCLEVWDITALISQQ